MATTTPTTELTPPSNVQPISAVSNTMEYSKNMASKSLSTVANSYKFVWHAWLGTAVTSQEAATSFAKNMAKKGEETEEKAREQLNERIKDARSASEKLRDRAAARLDAIEDRVGRGMSRSLHIMGVPTRGDVDKLALLMADMSESIEELMAMRAQQERQEQAKPKRPSTSS